MRAHRESERESCEQEGPDGKVVGVVFIDENCDIKRKEKKILRIKVKLNTGLGLLIEMRNRHSSICENKCIFKEVG